MDDLKLFLLKKTYSLSFFEGSVVSLQLKCNRKKVVATKEAKIMSIVFICINLHKVDEQLDKGLRYLV